MENQGVDEVEGAGGPRMSFAALASSPYEEPVDPEFDAQVRRDTHWSAKLACSMLKVSSCVVSAAMVHPGVDAEEGEFKKVTVELMTRANLLADAASELLGLPASDPRLPAYKNVLRLQAVEVVSTQWRLANGVGIKELSVDQMASMFRVVLDDGQLDKEAGLPPAIDLDEVTAKRLALVGVVPKIYEAVNCFDYLAPSPEQLVEDGVRKVIREADAGLEEIVSEDTRPSTKAVIAQSLIGKAGAIYAENYKAHARRDIVRLEGMDPSERARHLFIHRETGLPRDHIHESFSVLMKRMVKMVCEAVPSVDPLPAAKAPAAAHRADREVVHVSQPE